MPDGRPLDPDTRIAIEERAIFTTRGGEEIAGYLRSFRATEGPDEGTWGAWCSRYGAFRAIAARRI